MQLKHKAVLGIFAAHKLQQIREKPLLFFPLQPLTHQHRPEPGFILAIVGIETEAVIQRMVRKEAALPDKYLQSFFYRNQKAFQVTDAYAGALFKLFDKAASHIRQVIAP